MLGGCLARTGGIFVGLVSALAMWSAGSELLPAWGAVAALAVWERGWRAENPRFWRAWWMSGALGTAAAWAFEFWPNLFHGYLEFVSVWHVGLWLLCGGLLEFLGWRPMKPAARIAAVLVVISAAIVTAGAVKHFDWWHLHVSQDPLFQRQVADTLEFRSILDGGLLQGAERFAANYGLLVLLLLPAAGRFSGLSVRVKWALLVTLSFLVLAVSQERWGDFFGAALVITLGAVLQARWGGRPWLCVALIAVATLLPWRQAVETHAEASGAGAQPMPGVYGQPW